MKKLGPHEYWPIELAAKHLKTTVDELVHAAALGRIQLCINVFRMAEEVDAIRMSRPFRPEDHGLPADNEKSPFQIEFDNAQWEHWNRTKKGMPAGIYELAYDDANRLEMSAEGKISMTWASRYDGHDWWIVELAPAVDVGHKQIVMLQEELEKFKDSKVNDRPKMDAREHTAYLNVIGMLVHLLRSRPGKELSESALIQMIQTLEMRHRKHPDERQVFGLSERNLQEKFKSARHSLSMAGIQLSANARGDGSLGMGHIE